MRNCDRIIPITKTTIYLLILIISISVSSCTQSSTQPIWNPAETVHNVEKEEFLKMLWARPNIYIGITTSLGLATSSSNVFVIGSPNVDEGIKLNALDILDGKLVWQSESSPLFPILADEDGVYVEGRGEGGNVTKYDPESGEVLWSKSFWDSGGVLHLIMYENQLHAYLSPDKHKVLRTSDGKTIFSLFPKDPPFFDSRVCGISYQTPVYTVDSIYFRENEGLFKGEICAVDITTGKLRWRSDLGVISNVVASGKAVFVLVESGDLLALDPTNGQKISELSVSFDNKPFITYSVDDRSGNFFLAYDAQNDILLVYLGDSRQLYAFLIGEK